MGTILTCGLSRKKWKSWKKPTDWKIECLNLFLCCTCQKLEKWISQYFLNWNLNRKKIAAKTQNFIKHCGVHAIFIPDGLQPISIPSLPLKNHWNPLETFHLCFLAAFHLWFGAFHLGWSDAGKITFIHLRILLNGIPSSSPSVYTDTNGVFSKLVRTSNFLTLLWSWFLEGPILRCFEE